MNKAMADAPPKGPRARRIPTAILLWGAMVVANMAGMTVAVAVASTVRGVVDSGTTENALLALYYVSMLVVAAVDALLIDEVVFGGSFRLTHLQGRSARFARKDEEVELVAATLQRSNVSFPFVLLLCTIGTYMVYNATNHGFDDYWRRIGRHVATLRTTDPDGAADRREAVESLSLNTRNEAMATLLRALEREDETAAWAAWGLGRYWQDPRSRHLVRPLLRAMRRGDAELRREAVLALGRLQHRAIAEDLQAELEAELAAQGPVDRRVVWALGYIQHVESFPVLEKALHHQDDSVAAVAAWALAQHRDQRGGRAAVGILEARLPSAPHEVRCAIAHGLMIMGDESSNLALMHAFDGLDEASRATVCTKLTVDVRPDGEGDRQDLTTQETYAMKTLEAMGRMRATTGDVRAEVEPWLQRIADDDANSLATRQSASNLLAGIQGARNDLDPSE